MTVHLEFDIPVYRSDRYEQLERQGRIKVSSNIQTLEEGSLTQEYNRLKIETDILIADLNARTRIADEVSNLEDEIRWKSNQLKDLLNDIEKATQHYDALKVVLEKLGINPKASNLRFSNNLLLSAAGAQVEVSQTQIYSEF
ncbi:MAG: hypothetical protein ICV80_21545 [Microcoleus sp. T1-bin1]|nr:hypothetical protein [Microcoleus sp. T1-bin1]